MTTLVEHPMDCECEQCEVLLRKAFDEAGDAQEEDRRWALGLARLRRSLEMTQGELANAARLQKTTVSMLENGKLPITVRTLRRYGAMLKLSTLQVLQRIDEVSDAAPEGVEGEHGAGTSGAAEELETASRPTLIAALRTVADGELAWRARAEAAERRLEVARQQLLDGDAGGALLLLAGEEVADAS